VLVRRGFVCATELIRDQRSVFAGFRRCTYHDPDRL